MPRRAESRTSPCHFSDFLPPCLLFSFFTRFRSLRLCFFFIFKLNQSGNDYVSEVGEGGLMISQARAARDQNRRVCVAPRRLRGTAGVPCRMPCRVPRFRWFCWLRQSLPGSLSHLLLTVPGYVVTLLPWRPVLT